MTLQLDPNLYIITTINMTVTTQRNLLTKNVANAKTTFYLK